MTTVSRRSTAPPDAVWRVLADPWTYAAWVVGASRIRAVEGDWPRPESRILHSVGSWPILLNDDTSVIDSIEGNSITLQARSRPFGEATVEITVMPAGDGSVIRMSEAPTKGAATMLPAPVYGVPLRLRNTETLRRLALIAEGSSGNSGGSPDVPSDPH